MIVDRLADFARYWHLGFARPQQFWSFFVFIGGCLTIASQCMRWTNPK